MFWGAGNVQAVYFALFPKREDISCWKQAAQRKAAFISPSELWGLTGVWPQWFMLTPRLQRAES